MQLALAFPVGLCIPLCPWEILWARCIARIFSIDFLTWTIALCLPCERCAGHCYRCLPLQWILVEMDSDEYHT
ncbi:hypothetical protein BD311DRAFT_378989 [Dichomitus squalens]|uniref:Uncharacterized protein n=1 Tax=Dichomitus squalens TaxID=114155 RepID=A0A4Q9MIY9_9APHY|nr:hypothetical protein BD311DRAFT_378989 [Dichomitus squalens]